MELFNIKIDLNKKAMNSKRKYGFKNLNNIQPKKSKNLNNGKKIFKTMINFQAILITL